MTDSAYPGLTTGEDLFKEVIFDKLVSLATAELFVLVPWLAIWPIGPIVSFAVGIFAGKFFNFLKLTVDLEAITYVNELHQKEFDEAALKLKVVSVEKGPNSPEYEKAREDAKAALSQFVHFGAA